MGSRAGCDAVFVREQARQTEKVFTSMELNMIEVIHSTTLLHEKGDDIIIETKPVSWKFSTRQIMEVWRRILIEAQEKRHQKIIVMFITKEQDIENKT